MTVEDKEKQKKRGVVPHHESHQWQHVERFPYQQDFWRRSSVKSKRGHRIQRRGGSEWQVTETETGSREERRSVSKKGSVRDEQDVAGDRLPRA
jgi:hypothetical protein